MVVIRLIDDPIEKQGDIGARNAFCVCVRGGMYRQDQDEGFSCYICIITMLRSIFGLC